MLNSSQIERFERQGYLVVENVIDDQTLGAIRAEYRALMDKLYEGWYQRGDVNLDPGGLDFFGKLNACVKAGIDWFQPLDISLPHEDIRADSPMHFGPAVFDLLTHERLLDIVEQLIGSEITSNPIQHVRIKPPQRAVANDEIRAHIVATDWHQDQGVTHPEADETEFITCWLAITDATVKNGCLQVAANNFDKLLVHCAQSQSAIPDSVLRKDNAIPTPVKAGGMVIFHPLTPHASLPNVSQEYRWSFDIRYNVTGQPTGRSHFPDFIARSRKNPASELRDWREWKHMWEEARATLAANEPIPLHRWDSEAPYCA